jgi:hypothetical protein
MKKVSETLHVFGYALSGLNQATPVIVAVGFRRRDIHIYEYERY